MTKKMQYIKPKSLYQTGTQSSFDLDEVLDNPKLSFLIDEDRSVYYRDIPTLNRLDSKEVVKIDEATRREIIRDADKARIQRSKKLITYYLSVTDARGWIKFKTTSQYTKGLYYTQYIKLKEAKDMKYFKEFSKRDIIRLFLSGDLQVYCSCLVGDTSIKTLDGNSYTIREIVDKFKNGEDIWVYSVDSEGNFKPGKVSWAGMTKRVSALVKVTLDNGEVIKCTPDHLFMTRDCKYKRADELSLGESLMPLYFRNSKEETNGYELVKFNKYPGGYHSVYKEVANEVFDRGEWEEASRRSGENNIAIHHRDFNKLNNTPSNLQLMGKEEHIKYHADFVVERRKNDKEFNDKLMEGCRRHIKMLNANSTEAIIKQRKDFIERGHDYWRTEEGRKIKSDLMREVAREYWDNTWKNMSEEEYKEWKDRRYLSSEEGRKLLSEKRKEFWKNISKEDRERIIHTHAAAGGQGNKRKWENMSEEERLNCNRKRVKSGYVKYFNEMIKSNIPLTWENYKWYREEVVGTTNPVKMSKLFNSFEELLTYCGYSEYNHKVSNIEYILVDNEPVYDITVDKWHNFYLDAGVIVHNCHDFKYRYRYLTYHKGFGLFKEMRYPKIRNPFLQGTVCKHLLCVLTYMGMNYMRIYRDMVKSKFFKKKAQLDDEDNS